LKGDLQTIATTQNTTLDLSLKFAFSEAPVTYGGPVNSDQFSILHGFGEVEGSRKVAPGIFVGGSEELMDEVRMGRLDARETLFIKGHAAWVAGQLEKEVLKKVWYPAAASTDFIMRYASKKTNQSDAPSDLWSEIMECMGNDFAALAIAADGRGDYRMAP
jgi:putative transcriptional regulator